MEANTTVVFPSRPGGDKDPGSREREVDDGSPNPSLFLLEKRREEEVWRTNLYDYWRTLVQHRPNLLRQEGGIPGAGQLPRNPIACLDKRGGGVLDGGRNPMQSTSIDKYSTPDAGQNPELRRLPG